MPYPFPSNLDHLSLKFSRNSSFTSMFAFLVMISNPYRIIAMNRFRKMNVTNRINERKNGYPNSLPHPLGTPLFSYNSSNVTSFTQSNKIDFFRVTSCMILFHASPVDDLNNVRNERPKF